MVKAVQALGELASLNSQLRGQIVPMLLVKPMKQDSKSRQLAMQPDASATLPAQNAAHLRLGVIGRDLFLDAVNVLTDLLGVGAEEIKTHLHLPAGALGSHIAR